MPTSVEAFHAAWIEAWLKSDDGALHQMAAPDFLHVAPNGTSLSREELATKIYDRTYRIEWGKCGDVTVRSLGPDGAIVRYQWEVVGNAFGRTIDEDQETSLVCVREGEHWRAMMEHRRVMRRPPRSRPAPARQPTPSVATTRSSGAERAVKPTRTSRTPIAVNLLRDYKPRGLMRFRLWRASRSAPAPRTQIRINLLGKRKRRWFGIWDYDLSDWLLVIFVIALIILGIVGELKD